MINDNDIIRQTQCWLDRFIISHNICPFAKRERDKDRIRFVVDSNDRLEETLEHLIMECELLEQAPEIETTLFILEHQAGSFDSYLDFLELASELLMKQGYEGIFQLASFHPQYLFAGSSEDDPANYTNRSPYPMLHIIREESLEQALRHYPDPELIPERNIEYCQQMGLEKLQQILKDCCSQ